MSLYVRHSAWLHATPERPKKDHSDAPQLSRIERLRRDWIATGREDEFTPDMPRLEGAGYLIGYLWECGPTMASGMGAAPISHQEILAWQFLTGIELQPWEVRFLRRLSYEYLAELCKAEQRDCPAPWRTTDTKPEVSDTQAALRALANL